METMSPRTQRKGGRRGFDRPEAMRWPPLERREEDMMEGMETMSPRTPRTPRKGGRSGFGAPEATRSPPMERREEGTMEGMDTTPPGTPRMRGRRVSVAPAALRSPPRERGEEDLMTGLATPRRVSLMRGEREDLTEFCTPRTVTVMGRERELLEFHTPQHPSTGSNKWGGSSPLLARNIPKESLETKYLRLTTLRTRDEIFPVVDEDLPPPPPSPAKPGRGWLFPKLKWKGRKQEVMGGEHKKRSGWWPAGDHRSRWPQGW